MASRNINIDILVDIQRELITDITNLQDQLGKKQERLQNIKRILRATCNHKWIIDYIDQMNPFKEGIRIKYCEHCELSYD